MRAAFLGLALVMVVSAGASEVGFLHGVASGDPLTDAVILWTRVTPATPGVVEVRWQVASDEAMTKIVLEGLVGASAHTDYTVKVDARGLSPGRFYYYRFSAGAVLSPVGRTRTLPTGEVKQLKLAVFSCNNYPAGYFNAYRAAAARADVDLMVHLGDYLYEYGMGEYASENAEELGRVVDPLEELITLEDYRRRHAQYKADPDAQEIHRRFPFLTVWDDHELANNAWAGGAENHNKNEGEWAARRDAAVRAYHEWMPIRPHSRDELGKIYRRFDFGDLASLILLDTRLAGRDEQPDYGKNLAALKQLDGERFRREVIELETRSILGREQEAWLAEQLEDSKTKKIPWQVLGQQLIMAANKLPKLEGLVDFDHLPEGKKRFADRLHELEKRGLPWNLDAWDGYPAARRRLYRDVLAHARNLVVLSGDSHNAWAFDLKDDTGKQVGVELATTSVSSPGLEDYFPADPDATVKALYKTNPNLVYGDGKNRGYLLVTLTRKKVVAEWIFVDTILSRDFHERCAKALVAKATRKPGMGELRETRCGG